MLLLLGVEFGIGAYLKGVGIGLAASFGSTPLISSFLYGVEPHDPLTLILVSAFLIRRDHAGDVHSCAPGDEGRSHGDGWWAPRLWIGRTAPTSLR
jgi:hypothetical protein